MSDNLNPTRWERCRLCGTPFIRATGRKRHECLDCKMAKVMAISAQGRAKSGLWWEKVVRGQLRKWKGEAEALGITDD